MGLCQFRGKVVKGYDWMRNDFYLDIGEKSPYHMLIPGKVYKPKLEVGDKVVAHGEEVGNYRVRLSPEYRIIVYRQKGKDYPPDNLF